MQRAELVDVVVDQAHLPQRERRASLEHFAAGIVDGAVPRLDVALDVHELGVRIARNDVVEQQGDDLYEGLS